MRELSPQATKLVYALTMDGDWDVHRAGCRDVTRALNRGRYQQRPIPFEAASDDDVTATVIDDETRDMGYDETFVNVFPCVTFTA